VRTRVKICGITRATDALLAAKCGADAIGLVFYPNSPRAVTLPQAQEIVAALPAFVSVVGLFVDETPDIVQNALHALHLNVLQFHGEESPAYCQQFSVPYIKALRVRAETHIAAFADRYPSAQAILLDSYVKGVQGGTGVAFDWQQIPNTCSKPLILAGGLTPDNVRAAVVAVKPYAVDVSGGVESSKGIKDAAKLRAFFASVA